MKGYCIAHNGRRTTGRTLDTPIRPYIAPVGSKYPTKEGYIQMVVPKGTAGARHRTKGSRYPTMLEHRYVMQQHLGRPLLKSETVHHLDGSRANNDISNLELWVSSHPYGQRVEDHLKWAREIIARYGDLIERSAVSVPRIKQ